MHNFCKKRKTRTQKGKQILAADNFNAGYHSPKI
ncbi:hypothetical protein MAR_021805 [Mya arenaria]|uniref:Uncharacterized protein n=1 Tax=Mya arenaria TaxID=6604 RepID=A0ABY7ECL2_MYAAR|nr:hypothetical protein MAR_021805 [Mya arenaria]